MDHHMKLSDILQGNVEGFRSAWNDTEAAEDFSNEPIPAGT